MRLIFCLAMLMPDDLLLPPPASDPDDLRLPPTLESSDPGTLDSVTLLTYSGHTWTNHKSALFCVNQSEESILLCQPIRGENYVVSTNQRKVFTSTSVWL